MFRITKEFHFSASHQLKQMPEGHQCARLHGHNYVVTIELAREFTDGNGFVIDFGDLKPFQHYIDTTLDHRHLNDALGSDNGYMTTAEHLARHLFEWAACYWPNQIVAVRVSETPKTCAEYRR